MLATRQRAGTNGNAGFQFRKGVERLRNGRVKVAATQGRAGDAQIFLNGKLGENPMSLRYRNDTKPAHVLWPQPVDRMAFEHDLATRNRQRPSN